MNFSKYQTANFSSSSAQKTAKSSSHQQQQMATYTHHNRDQRQSNQHQYATNETPNNHNNNSSTHGSSKHHDRASSSNQNGRHGDQSVDRLKSCIADLKKLATRQASTNKRAGTTNQNKRGHGTAHHDDNQTYDHNNHSSYDQSITGGYKQPRSTSTFNPSIQSKQRGSKGTLTNDRERRSNAANAGGAKVSGALKKYVQEIENTTSHIMGRPDSNRKQQQVQDSHRSRSSMPATGGASQSRRSGTNRGSSTTKDRASRDNDAGRRRDSYHHTTGYTGSSSKRQSATNVQSKQSLMSSSKQQRAMESSMKSNDQVPSSYKQPRKANSVDRLGRHNHDTGSMSNALGNSSGYERGGSQKRPSSSYNSKQARSSSASHINKAQTPQNATNHHGYQSRERGTRGAASSNDQNQFHKHSDDNSKLNGTAVSQQYKQQNSSSNANAINNSASQQISHAAAYTAKEKKLMNIQKDSNHSTKENGMINQPAEAQINQNKKQETTTPKKFASNYDQYYKDSSKRQQQHVSSSNRTTAADRKDNRMSNSSYSSHINNSASTQMRASDHQSASAAMLSKQPSTYTAKDKRERASQQQKQEQEMQKQQRYSSADRSAHPQQMTAAQVHQQQMHQTAQASSTVGQKKVREGFKNVQQHRDEPEVQIISKYSHNQQPSTVHLNGTQSTELSTEIVQSLDQKKMMMMNQQSAQMNPNTSSIYSIQQAAAYKTSTLMRTVAADHSSLEDSMLQVVYNIQRSKQMLWELEGGEQLDQYNVKNNKGVHSYVPQSNCVQFKDHEIIGSDFCQKKPIFLGIDNVQRRNGYSFKK